MSFKAIECGNNRKLVHELLLVVYSNFRRITHRFLDKSCFNAENHVFDNPTCMTLNLKVMPSGCVNEIWHQKTRIMVLPYVEEIMIVHVGRTM